MTDRTNKQLKARRKQNAARQREIRADRDRLKQCRTCGDPAAVSERTGLLTKQCTVHLAVDAERKLVYILPRQSLEAAARRKFELEYPLSGALP
jgi:hypothetical protein